MPDVIVATSNGVPMMTERVTSELLADGFYAAQFVERLGWALHDAEEREQQDMSPASPAPVDRVLVPA